VINLPEAGDLGFTALAVGDDDTLYAARPLDGQVIALLDTDGDFLPDTPSVAAEGLTFPNGLTFANETLYISGGAHLYQLRGDELTTLVDDLPTGGGYWTGGIAVHEDRIYVGTGAPCAACEFDDQRRGAILSFTLNGEDEQVVISGLRQPNDLTFRDDQLFVVDGALDMVFAVDGGLTPLTTFGEFSTPLGLAFYNSDTYLALENYLLAVLSGSTSTVDLRGYVIVAINTTTGEHFPIMPAAQHSLSGGLIDHSSQFTIEEMNLRGSAFFPNHPFDIAVSPRGWVYISVSGGRILALRPYTGEG
jgi:glucose/arabinose dehydrogenase